MSSDKNTSTRLLCGGSFPVTGGPAFAVARKCPHLADDARPLSWSTCLHVPSPSPSHQSPVCPPPRPDPPPTLHLQDVKAPPALLDLLSTHPQHILTQSHTHTPRTQLQTQQDALLHPHPREHPRGQRLRRAHRGLRPQRRHQGRQARRSSQHLRCLLQD